MKIENKHIAIGLLIIGLFVGGIISYVLPKKNTVKVVIDNDKIIKAVERNGDSLRKIWDHEKDSILKTVPKLETEVKIIYKTLESENSISFTTRNIDSLRKGAINYIKKF